MTLSRSNVEIKWEDSAMLVCRLYGMCRINSVGKYSAPYKSISSKPFGGENFSLIEGNFPVQQVCLAHWNNKCLQLFWIHWTGIGEVFKYLVWPKPHHRWKAKCNGPKQNINREKALFKNVCQHQDTTATCSGPLIIMMWLTQVLL